MVGGKAVSAAEAEKYRERRGDYSPHHPGVARDQQAAALVAALASNDIAEAATFTEYVLQRHGDAATRSLTYRPKERSNAKHLEHLNLMASGEILEGGASDVISDELMEEARRGPAGRISTANGLMLFASSTGTALAEAWEISSEKARNNERISKERSARENLEGPLYQVMLDKGFVVPAQPTKKKKKGPSRRTITIAQLDHFNKAQRINHYPKSGNRDKKVAAILHFMKYAPEDVAWASVDETRPTGAFVIPPIPVTAPSETEEDLEEGGEIENPADLQEMEEEIVEEEKEEEEEEEKEEAETEEAEEEEVELMVTSSGTNSNESAPIPTSAMATEAEQTMTMTRMWNREETQEPSALVNQGRSRRPRNAQNYRRLGEGDEMDCS
eukprot:TRINITY_DN758_c0_g1_i10.p1 TRINITY_DN758_c0_g1~~TRINITY_DN758_c0_g1_i10.p1  ORF type:complete len:386 (-),score=96.39 TRINITY_DN758_c0_g1_i10:137-1294(-)